MKSVVAIVLVVLALFAMSSEPTPAYAAGTPAIASGSAATVAQAAVADKGGFNIFKRLAGCWSMRFGGGVTEERNRTTDDDICRIFDLLGPDLSSR